MEKQRSAIYKILEDDDDDEGVNKDDGKTDEHEIGMLSFEEVRVMSSDEQVKLSVNTEVKTTDNNKCDICYKTFRDRYILRRHMRNFHWKSEKIERKPLRRKENGSEQNAENISIKKKSCNICGKTYSSEYNLRRHMNNVNAHGFSGLIKEPLPTLSSQSLVLPSAEEMAIESLLLEDDDFNFIKENM